jgi:hypothetical protein
MTEVTIAERKITVGDHSFPLISGEVHYWRLDPANWRPILKKVKEMGIRIVATYVCWDYHEIDRGVYDFHGETDPRRNLVAFLDMLAEEDLWVILRPGPYIYSEWSNNGVPDHAAKFHRLDPKFLALADHYMRAVTEVALPYLATKGGRVILWQADNEIDPWPHLYTEQLGLGMQQGPFHDFLREKYGSIDGLNAAWQSAYTSFDEARAVSELFVNNPVLLSRYNDFRDFIHWYVAKVAKNSADTYRALGVDVPIIFNAYSGVATQLWSDLESIGDLAGPDIYPSRELALRPREHRGFLEIMRYASAVSKLPYIAEFEAGIWHEWLEDVGTLTPNHYRLMCMAALQSGTAGWNWYMLVNRDNWYQSPINEWGRVRPALFDVFAQITRLFYDIDPTTLDRQTDTAITYDTLQRSTERPGQDLLQSLYEADIDYDFWDVTLGKSDKKLAIYAGGNWLSENSQRNMLSYVENGGHLLLIGAYPSMDEHMRPLNLLGIQAPDGIVSASPGKLHLGMSGGYTVESGWAYSYDNVPGEPIIAERLDPHTMPSEELSLQFGLQTGACYTIGYTVTRGAGKISVIGLTPSPSLLLALHQWADTQLAVRSRMAGVSSALFTRGDERFVIATNPGAEAKIAQLRIDPAQVGAGEWCVTDMISGQETVFDPARGDLNVALNGRDGAVLRLTPIK